MSNREKAKKLFQSMEKIDPVLIDEAAEYLGYVVSGSRCILNLSLYLVRAA